MSRVAINNALVIKHDYRALNSHTAISLESVRGTVSVPHRQGVTREPALASCSNNQDPLSARLTAFGQYVSALLMALQRLWGGHEHKLASPVLPKPAPAVLPAPSLPVVDSPPGDFPELSSKRKGHKADDIWGGFRQGPRGNCVTVSAIKAAMARFGQSPTDIYKDVRKEGDSYRVTMRDGYTLQLSCRELAEAARAAKFVGRDQEMLKDAHFLFAVSAKRAQLENNDGYASKSFMAAVNSLNDSEDEYHAGEGLLRLGLRQHMHSVPVSKLAKGMLGMVNRRGHSVAVINGVEEIYGRRGRAPKSGEAIGLK